MQKITHPFSPVVDSDSKILILGSFPSVISRNNSFYYGNKNNRFWKVLDRIYGTKLDSFSNEQKKECLLDLHIALYDVVYSCTIIGSSDSTIEDVVYTDIKALLQNTMINKIYCNGKKAYSLFIKNNPDLINMTEYLPSTSSANASFSLEMLYEKWIVIKE